MNIFNNEEKSQEPGSLFCIFRKAKKKCWLLKQLIMEAADHVGKTGDQMAS